MGSVAGDDLGRWERAAQECGVEERILVSVRLRPLNEKEIFNRDPCDWECINDSTVIFKNSLPERSMFPTAYTFDKVFHCDCNTRQVYEEGAKDVALSVVSGINSSIFAYGQTSSGKTFTMTGITEYSVADIYDYIQKHEEREFVLRFSAMEIYNEAVRDLLSADSTPLRLLDDPERGTIVEKLTEETLRDWNHLRDLLAICEAQRQIGETSLNEMSSRSHQILRLTIESSAREYLGRGSSSTLVASVNFVDLAGSERASQAMSAGARLKEGCHINRSLLTLGTVIRKLSKGRNGHIPYRDSKLTRILQSSLGGNARTAIICTMSPARSHVEQSRNTLLFASCAKEVVTSAQVNVVMSDKALVKHLQRELARLENELRNPGVLGVCSSDSLIREKDSQIRKMEKEIKELIQQRDLANSQLQDLLHAARDDRSTTPPDFGDFSSFHLPNSSKDEDTRSESSSISFQPPAFSAKQINTSHHPAKANAIPSSGGYGPYSGKQDAAAERLNISSPTFIGLLQEDGVEDITSDNSEEFEDLCKEVRCIEMDETSLSRSGPLMFAEEESFPPPPANLPDFGDELLVPSHMEDSDSSNQDTKERVFPSEKQIENAKRREEIPSKLFCAEPSPFPSPSPWPSTRSEFPSYRSSVLSRSRSCRASIMQSPASPWFLDDDRYERTPPSIPAKDFPGRPEGIHKRAQTLKFGTANDVLFLDGSQNPEPMAAADTPTKQNNKTNSEEDIARICDFVAGMKEMAQTQYQIKQADGETVEEGRNEGQAIEKSVKDVGVDPMLNSAESPSHWIFEFEKQQQEIIQLWHECNVSLVHRTYFFLLFRGEPADSIYMEVELRRLSFLKVTFAKRDSDCSPRVGDDILSTLKSSAKALRRERDMLSRRMSKRLSTEEREVLFAEWGIALDSKNRRVQLSRLLWSRTDDMDHIRESASVVAKLIGLLEPGLALKEMFGLSFAPQAASRGKSSTWRYGMISLI